MKLWEITSGRLLRTLLKDVLGPVTALAFSTTGATLASGSVDRTVNLWDMETVTVRNSLVGHEGAITSLSFTPAIRSSPARLKITW